MDLIIRRAMLPPRASRRKPKHRRSTSASKRGARRVVEANLAAVARGEEIDAARPRSSRRLSSIRI